MKKLLTRAILPKALLFVAFGLWGTSALTHAAESDIPAGATNEISDSQIRDVVNRVARHQVVPLQEGNWPEMSTSNHPALFGSVTQPQGIAWYYSHGVMLYGLLQSTDVTHDESVSRFVVRHNQICAREYEWSEQILNQAKGLPGATNILRKSVIAGLL